jgi:integrase
MNRARLLALVAGMTALIVLLDYCTSAELLGSLLFVLPLALCILEQSKELLWGTASTATLLTAAAGVWSFHRIALVNPWVASVNRALLIASLLTLTTLIHLWINQSRQLLRASGELEQQRDQLTLRKEQLENELMKLKAAAKGRRKPLHLTIKQYQAFVAQLSDLHRTMVVTVMCSGVRVSEVLGMRWDQVDFAAGLICGPRGFANGRTSEGKAEAGPEKISMDPVLAEALMEWRSRNPGAGLVFPSHITGRCYHAGPIQQDYFRPAARKLGLSGVCWHTFPDSYRSWLKEEGTGSGAVQQQLMRHADSSTVTNIRVNGSVKTKAKGKREPAGKVGRRVLPSVGFRVGTAKVAHSANNSQSG